MPLNRLLPYRVFSTFIRGPCALRVTRQLGRFIDPIVSAGPQCDIDRRPTATQRSAPTAIAAPRRRHPVVVLSHHQLRIFGGRWLSDHWRAPPSLARCTTCGCRLGASPPFGPRLTPLQTSAVPPIIEGENERCTRTMWHRHGGRQGATGREVPCFPQVNDGEGACLCGHG